MTIFAVITEVEDEGNYATGEAYVNPTIDNCTVGSKIIINPSKFNEKLFAEAVKKNWEGCTTIDLTKEQMFFCSVPVFRLGEIMVMDSEHGRTIPDGRKPSKWFVSYETFEDIELAIKRAKEVVGDKE